jgi:hypothetical protein
MKARRKPPRDRHRAELAQQMYDLLCGANGGYELVNVFSQEIGLASELGVDSWARWIGAMQKHLKCINAQQREFIGEVRLLDRYDTFDGALNFLFDLGVRAERSKVR